jgi:DNA modification methylase
MNHLYYGDNLTIMAKMPPSSVDLIYLDPPFNSKRNYNLMYRNMTGKPVPEQAEAFCDTWELDAEKEAAAKAMPVLMREYGVEDYYIQFWRLWIDALRHTQPHLLAYLIYMVQRLLHMKLILRNTGSIYLHCDPTASHYIKVMMDGIFGHQNFRNEIIWKRTSSHGGQKRWGPVHDVILFYSKSDEFQWNATHQTYDKDYVDSKYGQSDERGSYMTDNLTGAGKTEGDSGKPWRGVNPSDIGRHWAVPRADIIALVGEAAAAKMTLHERLDLLDQNGLIVWPKRVKKNGAGLPRFKRYLGHGVSIQDVVTDIPPINSQAKERLGYPTQKPSALLERIIKASSNKDDVVFDPFCGCGTTVYAAEKLGRTWIGCDIAVLSVLLIRDTLIDRYKLTEGKDFEVDGIPTSYEGAQQLFKRDPFQFQHWLVERVDGFPMQKKTADKGIDGRVYFETREGLKEMVLSVKGGNVRPTDLRDLRGVLEREGQAEMGGFLCLQEPSKAMREEAGRAGMYVYHGISYPRIQILTVRDILEGKQEFHTPSKVGAKVRTGQQSFAYYE